ncbi:MAG: 2-amino-4-hydroxy-6-hydroxymethyldihydropteridine diphosphokinase [Deltaproteobacteria bacterium]|nr:2-amino-4-hydroxy-6-hydroxymethyldihydropteridine diphosphokinase [Deltaproteobacteria bacterium]
MAETAYIGIGSNLGDPLQNCLTAIRFLDEMQGCHLESQSGFYRTEPVGVTGQEWYVNGVVSLKTERSPQHLLEGLLALEKRMGRVRTEKWGSRVIDLDLLIHGARVIDEAGLIIPHPRMHERRFVLVPMVDVAPTLVHPVYGKRMIDLLDACQGKGQDVIPLEEK